MLELFETPLTVLHIFVCLFLILVVLIQPGKSGGIGAALGGAGAQQVFGGRGAGNFLSKLTWVSATTFFLTSVVLAYISSSVDDTLADLAAPKTEAPGSKKTADEKADEPAAGGTATAQPDEPPAPPAEDTEAAAESKSEPAAEPVAPAPKPAAPKAPAAPAPKAPAAPTPRAPVAPTPAAPVAPTPAAPVAPTPAAPAPVTPPTPAVPPAAPNP